MSCFSTKAPFASDSAFSFTHSGSLRELRPALGRRGPALVPQHVHQRAAFQRLIIRSPVPDTMHPQPFEDLRLLLAKPLQQRLQLPLIRVIDPQLIHHTSRIARTLGFKPTRGRHHHRRSHPLQYLTSIHLSPFTSCTLAISNLRRKIRQRHIRGVHLLHQLSVHLRRSRHLHPLRVVMESLPVRRRRRLGSDAPECK